MDHIQWNCPAAVGIAHLDEQHWELHRMLWTLLRTLETAPDGALPEFQFIHLVKKTSDHFKSEEEFFKTKGYPDLVSHQIDHKRILDGLEENLNRWNAPGVQPLVDLVEEFGMTNQRHMITLDNAFAVWLEEKNGWMMAMGTKTIANGARRPEWERRCNQAGRQGRFEPHTPEIF